MGAIEDMRVSKTRPPGLLAGPFKRVCLHYRQKVHETGRLLRALAPIRPAHHSPHIPDSPAGFSESWKSHRGRGA